MIMFGVRVRRSYCLTEWRWEPVNRCLLVELRSGSVLKEFVTEKSLFGYHSPRVLVPEYLVSTCK